MQQPVHDFVRRARRRLLAQSMIRWGGVGLSIGLGAALLAVLGFRMIDHRLATAISLAIVGLGLVIGLGFAVARQPVMDAVARTLDLAFNLRDRVATAYVLADAYDPRRHDADFAGLVRQDADRSIRGLNVRSATPLRITPAWFIAGVLAVLLVVADRFMPTFNVFGPDEQTIAALQQQEEEEREQKAAIAEEIESALANLPEEAGDDQLAGAGMSDEVDALRRLAEQLAGPKTPGEDDGVDADNAELPEPQDEDAADDEAEIDPDAARTETADRMNRLAERLEREAQRQQAAADELARRFAGMSGEQSPPRSSEAFEEALQRGDFGAAADELSRMMNEREAMTPEEREAVANRLREMTEQLREPTDSPDADPNDQPTDPSPTDAQRDLLEQVLRDQGLDDQQIDELMNEQTAPEEFAKELQEEHNVDPELSREIADAAEDLRRRQEVEDEVERRSEDIADALDRAADQIDPTQAPPDQPPADPNTMTDESTDPPTDPGAETPPAATPPTPPDAGAQPPADQQTPPQDQQEQAPSPQDGQSQDQREQESQQEGGTEQQTGEQTQQQEQGPSGQQPGAEQQQQQGQQGQQGQDGQQQGAEPQQGQQPQGQQGQQQGQQGQQQEPQGESQQQPGGPTSPIGMREGEQAGENGQGAERPVPSPDGQPGPGDQPQPGQQPGQAGQEQGQPGAGQSPDQTLRDLEAMREAARQRQENAERLRESAQRVADDRSPEEREQWGQPPQPGQDPSDGQPPQPGGMSPDQPPEGAMGQPSDGQGMPGAGPEAGDQAAGVREGLPPTERLTGADDLMDLTGDEAADQLIAEWLSDEPVDPAARTQREAAIREAIQRSQRAAERAVDDEAVPTRYHRFIQKYFGNLKQGAGGADAGSSADSASAASGESGDGGSQSSGGDS